MRSELRVEAREDLAEAAEFYDRQRSGLGDYFVDCIFADLKGLEQRQVAGSSSPRPAHDPYVPATNSCQSDRSGIAAGVNDGEGE